MRAFTSSLARSPYRYLSCKSSPYITPMVTYPSELVEFVRQVDAYLGKCQTPAFFANHIRLCRHTARDPLLLPSPVLNDSPVCGFQKQLL